MVSRAEAPSAKQTSRPQQPRSSHFLSARWPRRRRSIRRSVTSHASQQLRPPYSSPFRSADALSAEPQKLCSPRRSIVRRAAAHPPRPRPPRRRRSSVRRAAVLLAAQPPLPPHRRLDRRSQLRSLHSSHRPPRRSPVRRDAASLDEVDVQLPPPAAPQPRPPLPPRITAAPSTAQLPPPATPLPRPPRRYPTRRAVAPSAA